MKEKQGGFTLITAIFLLTAVAGLVVFMTNIRVVQQTTLLYGVQGARAIQAARSGVQWGIYQAVVLGSCAATTPLSDAAYAGFSIDVQCAQSAHLEDTTTIDIYQITAIASSGSYGTLDYVQRRIQATVSADPP